MPITRRCANFGACTSKNAHWPKSVYILVVFLICIGRIAANNVDNDDFFLEPEIEEHMLMKRQDGDDVDDEITEEEQEVMEIANEKFEEEATDAGSPAAAAAEDEEIRRVVIEYNETTTEYEFIIELTNEYYCEKYGPMHVLCAYSVNRTKMRYYNRGVNETEMDFITRFIVRLRKRVLYGKEDKGDPGPLPKAVRIKVIRWNQELSVIAQRLANQCRGFVQPEIILATDSTTNIRVNFAVSKDTLVKPRWTQALLQWYNEVNHVKPDVVFRKNTGIDNYAAMVWSSTAIVGCGFAACRGKNKAIIKFYVCAFAPPGNIDGQKLYFTDPSEIEIPTTTPKPPPEETTTTTTTRRPTTRKNPFKKVVFREEWDLG